jgi:hypothetical protein
MTSAIAAGCFFINALLEFEDHRHQVHQESRRHLALIRP